MANSVQQHDTESNQRMGYFRTDDRTWKRLKKLADKEQLSVSDVVRRAIREFLSRMAA